MSTIRLSVMNADGELWSSRYECEDDTITAWEVDDGDGDDITLTVTLEDEA